MASDQEEFDFEIEDDEVIVELTPGGTELLSTPSLIYSMDLQPLQPRNEFVVPNSNVDPQPVEIPDIHPSELSTKDKVERAINALMRFMRAGHPIAGAYSGGKDSSVMAVLILEAARRLKELGETVPKILFTHARTGIDNPAMDMVAQMEISRIQAYAKTWDLPVGVDVVEPYLNDSWAVRIISGRALPTFANSSARDCAIDWKLVPQQRQRKRIFKELKTIGEPIVCVGTRYEESASRSIRMNAKNRTRRSGPKKSVTKRET